MSSHREAPAISKDPVADNTDTYAFVSPRRPGHGHDHLELPAARGAVRRSELLRVRRRRPLRDPHRQRRRRRAGDHLRVRVPDRGAQPGHVPVQHRPDRLDRQPELEPAPVLHGHPGEERPPQGARRAVWPARRATSGRPRRRTTRASPAQAVHKIGGGHTRVRRPAARGLLRRPRRDLRPRRPAAVPEPAPRGDGRGARGRTPRNDFSVHSIALKVPKHELTRDGSDADGSDGRQVGDRRVDGGQPAARR